MKITIAVDTTKAAEVNEALVFLAQFIKVDVKKTTGRVRPNPETKPEPKAEPEPEVEAKPEPKPEPEPEVETPPPAEEVTLAMLKTEAKGASGKVGREDVLKVIKRYGAKLADVTENNYQALYNDLKGL
jgi:outer membrane biosynthesis protein TonB